MDEMPNTPWWSSPSATAVLPPTTSDTEVLSYGPPTDPPAAPRPKRRLPGGTATLLALALVAGGAVGGGVAETLHDDAVVVSGTTTLSGNRVVGKPSDTVTGTPESAAAVIGPKVVTIEVTGTTSSGGFFNQQQSQSGTGSGVVYRVAGADTYIVTNNHVVDLAAGGSGSVHVTLASGDTVEATVVGTDPTTDLAVIKIATVPGLEAAEIADSEALKVGQAVLAVGAPLGLSNTTTQGIVSTLHRPVRTGENVDSQSVIDAIQTDAAINPGNSGGALVDLAGRLVGINSAIATDGSGSGNIGVGFSIPSAVVTKIADQLVATGRAVHSQIGVSVGDAQSTTTGAPGLGAAISAVSANGPAARAGLQAGDIVTKVNDRRVTDADSLIVAVRSYDPGTTVTLTLTRGGATRTLKVTLASASS